MIDLKHIKKVHFIGIGGIGISALALLMHHEGKVISGTNDNPSPDTLDRLRALGVEITIGADIKNIPLDIDLIVYSLAWDDRAPELMKEVRSLGIPVFSYPQALGLVSADKFTIAVSGTHGKTTTTAMISKVMIDAGLDPTVVVGSLLNDTKSNFIAGKSNYFVVEACEYRRSFLNLNPDIAIITNIDDDHLDYYKDLNEIQNAFAEFVGKLSSNGFLICDTEDPLLEPVISATTAQLVNYKEFPYIEELLVPGKHNIKNAQAVVGLAQILKIDQENVIQSLKNFTGTWRRFEYKGKTKTGALVYDDYAHHPTEIKATIQGARELMVKKKMSGQLIVIFQPHLYSRTKMLLADFATSLALADRVILTPIYAAREPADPAISSEILAGLIKTEAGPATAVTNFNEAVAIVAKEATPGDLILVMGAGDIAELGSKLVEFEA